MGLKGCDEFSHSKQGSAACTMNLTENERLPRPGFAFEREHAAYRNRFEQTARCPLLSWSKTNFLFCHISEHSSALETANAPDADTLIRRLVYWVIGLDVVRIAGMQAVPLYAR